MTTALLPTVEVEPATRAAATVIFLHGLGADGHDFEPIVPHLRVDGVRFVFPHAPKRPVTINAGYVMPAWFDVGEGDLLRGETSDLAGVKQAEGHVRALIEREVARGIPARRIVLGGFSQGGALAAWTVLRHEQPLAGAIALSTFMARNAPIEADSKPANRAIPVFGAHGTVDQVVPVTSGRHLRDRLIAMGCEVEWHEYPMGHEVCMEEIAAWGGWLRTRLA